MATHIIGVETALGEPLVANLDDEASGESLAATGSVGAGSESYSTTSESQEAAEDGRRVHLTLASS